MYDLLIIMENNQKGGLDTFTRTLIRGLLNKNIKIGFLVNSSHPGLKDIKKEFQEKIYFVEHQVPLAWRLTEVYLSWFPKHFRRVLNAMLKYFLCVFQFIAMYRLIADMRSKSCLVINGSYPGGETSRISTIAFALNSFLLRETRENVHCFHGYAVQSNAISLVLDLVLDALVVLSASNIISVTDACCKSILRRFPFKYYKHFAVIHNGLDFNTSNAVASLAANKDEKNIILNLANFGVHKGHAFLIKVFDSVCRDIPDVELKIYGIGSYEETKAIELLIEQSNYSSNIEINSFVADVYDRIQQAKVVAISSQYPEAFGLTAVEAMMMRKPIVSTNVGGLSEVIGDDEVAGFLHAPDDIVGFSNSLKKCLTDQELANRMGTAGQKRARRLFTSERMTIEYMRFLGL